MNKDQKTNLENALKIINLHIKISQYQQEFYDRFNKNEDD